MRPTPRPTPTQLTKPDQHTEITGKAEEWGPLVRQPPAAARTARVLHHAAQELWDACTDTDAAQMYEEARAIASRILAACPIA